MGQFSWGKAGAHRLASSARLEEPDTFSCLKLLGKVVMPAPGWRGHVSSEDSQPSEGNEVKQ